MQNTIEGTAVQNAQSTFYASLKTDGVLLTQADITAITWSSWDDQDQQIVAPTPLTVAEVISDTPQYQTDDPGWKQNYPFNFKAPIPGQAFPNGDVPGLIECEATLQDGSNHYFFASVAEVVKVRQS